MNCCLYEFCHNGTITGSHLCPQHTKSISGKEFYYLARQNALKWNNGNPVSSSIIQTFLFNALHYPDEEFPFDLPPIHLKNERMKK